MAQAWFKRKSFRYVLWIILIAAAGKFVPDLARRFVEQRLPEALLHPEEDTPSSKGPKGQQAPPTRELEDLAALPRGADPESDREIQRSGLALLPEHQAVVWLESLPRGVYAFAHTRTIANRSGPVRATPNRSLDFEVHKTRSGELLVLAFVSAADAERIRQPKRTKSITVTIHSDAWKSGHALVRIPIARIRVQPGTTSRIMRLNTSKHITALEVLLAP